jgi:IS30 family transposase
MTTLQRKAFLAEHGIKITEIAAGIGGRHHSTVSHTIAGRRNDPVTQQKIVAYIEKKARKRVPDFFSLPARAA